MLWQASPSVPAVLIPRALKWLLVLLVCLVVGAWLGSSLAGASSAPSARESATAVQWGLVLLPLAIMASSLGTAYARLHATLYRAPRQRLEITSGVFGQRIVSYELRDAVVDRPLVYRFFGVGNLTITHRTKPPITVEAIQHPQGVRDAPRSSGQFEAARFEKAAWR